MCARGRTFKVVHQFWRSALSALPTPAPWSVGAWPERQCAPHKHWHSGHPAGFETGTLGRVRIRNKPTIDHLPGTATIKDLATQLTRQGAIK